MYKITVKFNNGVNDLKSVVCSLDNKLKELIGDIHFIFAMKKRVSIGNCIVSNIQLSLPTINANNQKCNGGSSYQLPKSGCQQ